MVLPRNWRRPSGSGQLEWNFLLYPSLLSTVLYWINSSKSGRCFKCQLIRISFLVVLIWGYLVGRGLDCSSFGQDICHTKIHAKKLNLAKVTLKSGVLLATRKALNVKLCIKEKARNQVENIVWPPLTTFEVPSQFPQSNLLGKTFHGTHTEICS